MSYAQGYRDGCRDAARLLRDVVVAADRKPIDFAGGSVWGPIVLDAASAIEALDAPEGSEAKELERGKEGR